jgi:NADPH-dependent 2,4-dienoyl-CoA reductase/sulfur reductase-like enzyme
MRTAQRHLGCASFAAAAAHVTHADIAVIGGGIIGLALARVVALSGASVALLEAEPQFGTQNSTRNSQGARSWLF